MNIKYFGEAMNYNPFQVELVNNLDDDQESLFDSLFNDLEIKISLNTIDVE